jgi:hypothetical protein
VVRAAAIYRDSIARWMKEMELGAQKRQENVNTTAYNNCEFRPGDFSRERSSVIHSSENSEGSSVVEYSAVKC